MILNINKKRCWMGKSDADQTVIQCGHVSAYFGSIPKMSSRYANTTQDMESVFQPMRGQHCPALTNQDPDLVSPPGYVQSPCGDTDPESRWSELCNYTQLPSQSETSVWGH